MARILNVSNDSEKNNFISILQKSIQSANLNFLFGSGCSFPAIKPLGNIEREIDDKIKKNNIIEANKQIKFFLYPFYESLIRIKTKKTNSSDNETISNYSDFTKIISRILYERKNKILPKQVSIFTTNYDLYFELAFKEHSDLLIIFDGFNKFRSFEDESVFSISEYFNTLFNNGTIYNYQVEVPSINLIKLHGSLNWTISDNKLINSIEYIDVLDRISKSNSDTDIEDFINAFTLVLPAKSKFKETIINQTYYDQLRIFANELDKENTLLIVQGFSFADEHFCEIVKRALRNPTLEVIIFCYDDSTKVSIENKFKNNSNVMVVYKEGADMPFPESNAILSDVLPLYLKRQNEHGGLL